MNCLCAKTMSRGFIYSMKDVCGTMCMCSSYHLFNECVVVCRFHWPVSKLDAKNFSIYPMHGYCSPGMEVPFTVSFHPVALNLAIRNEVLSFVRSSVCL